MCSTPSLGRDQFAKSWFKKATYASRVLWLCTRRVMRPEVSRDKCFRTTKLGTTHRRLLGSSGELMPGCANEKDELEDVKTTLDSQGLARDQPQLGLPT